MGASGAMMAAGAVTKAAGSYQQAQAQRSSLGYQASVAENNAAIAQDQASITEDNGQVSAMNQGLKVSQVLGSQRAQLAANGVDLGSGSANNLLTTTKVMGNRDVAQIKDNALRQVWGYQTQASDDLANAKALNSMRDGISPGMSVASSLVGSAAQASSAWNTYAAANGKPSTGAELNKAWDSTKSTVSGWFN